MRYYRHHNNNNNNSIVCLCLMEPRENKIKFKTSGLGAHMYFYIQHFHFIQVLFVLSK